MPARRASKNLFVICAAIVVAAVALALVAGHPSTDPSLEEASIPGNRDGTPGRRMP